MKPLVVKMATAILALPFTVTVIIPAIVVWATLPFSFLYFDNRFYLLYVPGVLLILCGLALLYTTISLFFTTGKGTLAPWNPTQKLVVKGPYRYVRNPMILGVQCILVGQALVLGSYPLVFWYFLFLILNHFYFVYKEEPGLQKRFGSDYTLYKNNVPRWFPRFTPWYQNQ